MVDERAKRNLDTAYMELGGRAYDEIRAEDTIEISALLTERSRGARFAFSPNEPTEETYLHAGDDAT